MKKKVNQWLQTIQNILYPPTCLLCSMPGDQQLDLCQACLDTLPRSHYNCPTCGNSIHSAIDKCLECIKYPPAQDSTQAVFLYQGSVPYLITALKFRKDYASGRVLGNLMADHFFGVSNKPDLPAIPVLVIFP